MWTKRLTTTPLQAANTNNIMIVTMMMAIKGMKAKLIFNSRAIATSKTTADRKIMIITAIILAGKTAATAKAKKRKEVAMP